MQLKTRIGVGVLEWGDIHGEINWWDIHGEIKMAVAAS